MAAAPLEVVDRVDCGLRIDGQSRPSGSQAAFAVHNPATGEAIAHVADATADDGLAALAAADTAQNAWAATPPRERAEMLRRAYDLVMQRSDELAALITLEMGKPLADSRGEVAYGGEFLRWFAEEASRVAGRYQPSPQGESQILTLQRPVGPSVLITPWNFPLAMGTRKIAPAIAAGCTMVVKPAAQTPLTTLALATILDEAGVPPGVVNVVPTSASGELITPLLGDSRLRKLSFTGSTAVGRLLIAQSADQVLRVSMELGGNAPFVVFGDADLDAAVEGAMVAKLRNMGQSCVAANRFVVESSVAQPFAERLAERMGQQRLGPGWDPDVDVGPLIQQRACEQVAGFVDDAVSRGATLLAGGTAPEGPGSFFSPTVLADVPDDAALLHDEIFGPVAPITTFDDEDEAIARANATDYGLVAYCYTENLRRALRVIERLEVGMVGLNRGLVSNAAGPFGGVKHSGIGREGGAEGIEEYLETRYVSIAP